MSLPQPSQPALLPAPGLPLSPHSLPDCSSPPHWLQQTDRLDDASFQPSDFTRPDRHVDDTLQSHHPPVAAPSYSHVSGASVQDLLFPPGHFKTKEEKEDRQVDDTLQPSDHSHHRPVAAPSYSHVSGASVQDLLFPPGHFKTKEEKEDRARAL